MRTFANNSATFKRAVMTAVAGVILSGMATASFAQTTRLHRAPATGGSYDGGTGPGYDSAPRYIAPGQCMTDEGNGRFLPCDGGNNSGG